MHVCIRLDHRIIISLQTLFPIIENVPYVLVPTLTHVVCVERRICVIWLQSVRLSVCHTLALPYLSYFIRDGSLVRRVTSPNL